MRTTRHESAESFLKRAGSFLSLAEVKNNLILGIATALAQSLAPAGQLPYLATIEERDTIVGCALRTPPHKLVITRIRSEAAPRALADDVLQIYPELSIVMGPEPSVGAFASHWSARTGTHARPTMRQRLYENRIVRRPPEMPCGSLRQATQDDLPLLVPWMADFLAAMSEPRGPDRARARAPRNRQPVLVGQGRGGIDGELYREDSKPGTGERCLHAAAASSPRLRNGVRCVSH